MIFIITNYIYIYIYIISKRYTLKEMNTENRNLEIIVYCLNVIHFHI